MNSNKVKPFLRWAGGKNWLVGLLAEIVDVDTYGSYYEPFLGGGSVFFELHPKGEVFLSDTNEDLISTYQAVKSSPNEVWAILSTYQNTEFDYYSIRALDPIDPIDPIINIDGKTEDGSMPYNLLKKQLELLK